MGKKTPTKIRKKVVPSKSKMKKTELEEVKRKLIGKKAILPLTLTQRFKNKLKDMLGVNP